MSTKKKAPPRDKVTLERDPVSHKPVVMLRLTVDEARVLRFVCSRIGGIGKSRNIMTTIGIGVASVMWKGQCDAAPSWMPTCATPPKYADLRRLERDALYLYDTKTDAKTDDTETSTDPRAPIELDVKKRAIVLE